ncbi:MAG TPA: energy-coupling factor transporter transmembrane protein EcfT [Candidatus Aveggerthella stercoripullorum]|uniref:Energy-coupling factor transporter transmembrane protein EcfT n=1 Tax=Candidatus Aveggerthella stercoripullorum TaxID=2840688 RepID=A0A9D1A079_9ACTN|nr:energy-coupling factor transporter transmembrane protein EcfT [Candidatus Aveggerthella stercoripullorum]
MSRAEDTGIRTGVLGLDPRTHLATFLAVGVAAMLVTGLLETALLQAIAAAYLAANGRPKLAVKACVSFAAVCGLSFLPLSGLYGVLFVSILHMVPPFTVGCALFTLSPSAIMCALDRWHVPQGVLVGICMMFRFVSILSFEGRSIVRGIRMRGIFPRAIDAARRPVLAYECVYTPLVMRSLRLSSELAASAELRGIEIGEGRTSVYHVGFSARDAACTLLVIASAAVVYALGVVL